jgi:hypothetical protein
VGITVILAASYHVNTILGLIHEDNTTCGCYGNRGMQGCLATRVTSASFNNSPIEECEGVWQHEEPVQHSTTRQSHQGGVLDMGGVLWREKDGCERVNLEDACRRGEWVCWCLVQAICFQMVFGHLVIVFQPPIKIRWSCYRKKASSASCITLAIVHGQASPDSEPFYTRKPNR